MKRYFTHSDGGCFLFGDGTFSFSLPNGYGDCRNTVLVFEDNQEYVDYMKKEFGTAGWYRASDWQTTLRGKFFLYNYDCSDMKPDDIKVKFDGEYSVYLRHDAYERPILFIVKK